MVREAVKAAENLEKKEFLSRSYRLTYCFSIRLRYNFSFSSKTGRVVVVQEAQRQAGIGAMVMSEISERAI